MDNFLSLFFFTESINNLSLSLSLTWIWGCFRLSFSLSLSSPSVSPLLFIQTCVIPPSPLNMLKTVWITYMSLFTGILDRGMEVKSLKGFHIFSFLSLSFSISLPLPLSLFLSPSSPLPLPLSLPFSICFTSDCVSMAFLSLFYRLICYA